jgi:hypothetical protein
MALLSVLEPSVTIRVYAIKTELESVRSIPLTTQILINLAMLETHNCIDEQQALGRSLRHVKCFNVNHPIYRLRAT